MPTGLLVLNNNSAENPQSVDLSAYLDLQDGKGMDPADPAFSNRIWSRSLLKDGATLSMEQLTERELTFPVHLGPVGIAGAPVTLSQTLALVQQVNAILESPGATAVWQPPGASQSTTFDVLSGILEVAYSYWAENQNWTSGNLRIFTKPLGRPAGPRFYATASGIGPVLMISPYASTGAQSIGASTQAGKAGFGGQPNGASTGVFYWSQPSLAGDAPARLQISYQGPRAANAVAVGRMPYVAVSLLPDQNYRPVITAPQLGFVNGYTPTTAADAVASQYLRSSFFAGPHASNVGDGYGFGRPQLLGPYPANWAGSHRVFGIARASVLPQSLALLADAAVPQTTVATVYPGDWQLVDLGTFTLRPSQAYPMIISLVVWTSPFPASTSVNADLTALVVLPDNATWYFNPQTLETPSQAAQYSGTNLLAMNQLQIDDVLGEQTLWQGQASLPAPGAANINSFPRLTPFSRGLVPRPDPKGGMPVIAILGMGQMSTPSTIFSASAAWANPQNLPAYAQVSVLEQYRYVAG